MQITKASGDTEAFSEKKLLASLKRANVPQTISQQTLRFVKDKLTSDTNTDQIHNLTLTYLKNHALPLHYSNYHLKRALFQLGPTGYPFEQFVSELLKKYDYQTQVGQIFQGKCVKHEIDILARKANHQYLIECKFHNQPGIKTDIQVALYTKARFDDITANSSLSNIKSWLITNTKASKEAIKYTSCQNLKLTTWGYPANENLHQLIISANLHPVTCLNSLNHIQKQSLINQDIITVQKLKSNLTHQSVINLLSRTVIKAAKHEISQIFPQDK